MDGDGERLSFTGRALPHGFAARRVEIDPGCERKYESAEWSDALVVVEAGELELECIGGTRARFDDGAVLHLDSLPLRTLRNCGRDALRLTAVSRDPSTQTQRSNAMKRIVVQYKVKPDHAARNEELVRDVYEELARTQPEDFHYATLRLDDGVTFIHIAEQPEDGGGPLPALESFRRFSEGIRERCDEPPVVRAAREVGSFRMFPSA